MLGYALAAGLILWMLVIAWQIGRSVRAAPVDRLAKAYRSSARSLRVQEVPREPRWAAGLRDLDRRPAARRCRMRCCWRRLTYNSDSRNDMARAERTEAIRFI